MVAASRVLNIWKGFISTMNAFSQKDNNLYKETAAA
jgi:hypothetical protein